uniref:Thyroglobulin type-1 domain-containing protein n=1 Tax=Sinocyclocheilus grahami TaxID=75366 RepID=A0A672L8F3_SINGR
MCGLLGSDNIWLRYNYLKIWNLRYVPSCDAYGAYEPLQCHASVAQCWCVDSSGQELPGSRAQPSSRPMCKSRERLLWKH